MFTIENLTAVGLEFAHLMAELLLMFVAISFLVALLQVYVSPARVKRILTRPRKVENALLGAALGAATPFCSCSTIPVLTGLFKSGAPFSGAISFLLTSPILNPAVIILLVVFFGAPATAVYTVTTLAFAVCAGLLLDSLGFERYVKLREQKDEGGCCCCKPKTWENFEGTFWQKQGQSVRVAARESLGLFRQVIPWLLVGAGVGACIHGFVPTELLANLAGADSWLAIPIAAVAGIPMYIRTETMIPIAGVLMGKGVSAGAVIALVIGGAGASIPEVTLLGGIFKKQMVATFVGCVLVVAIATGVVFNVAL